ncbi:hypothetical protein HDE_03468 [Halotydeus destructor]|nr:hypothetical protein HDE_03468 [Halotydeus destructor]
MFVDLKTLVSIAALLATISSSNGAETRTDRTSRRRSATSTSKKMKSTSKTTSTTTTTLSPVTEILVSETTLSLRLSESDITETNLTSSELITDSVSASTEPITTPILTTTVAEVEVASTIQIVETTSTEPSTVTVSSTPRRTVPTRASTIKLITTEGSRRSSTRQQSTAKATNKKGTVNSVPLVYSSFSQNQNDECVFDRYMNCSSDEPVICYGHGPIECTNNYTRSRRNSSKSRFNCIMAPTLKCTANIMNCSGKAMCQLDDETADSDGQASRPVASIQKLPSYKEGGHDGQHPEPLTYSEMAIITVLSALGVLVLASVALAAYLSYSKIKIGPEIRITNSRGEDRRI